MTQVPSRDMHGKRKEPTLKRYPLLQHIPDCGRGSALRREHRFTPLTKKLPAADSAYKENLFSQWSLTRYSNHTSGQPHAQQWTATQKELNEWDFCGLFFVSNCFLWAFFFILVFCLYILVHVFVRGVVCFDVCMCVCERECMCFLGVFLVLLIFQREKERMWS